MLKILILLVSLSFVAESTVAQDTTRISLAEFIDRGLERSGQVQYEYGAVELAENRVGEARSRRILPSVNLNTNHGLIPGVKSDTDLPPEQFYLDPNLSNDWEDWAIFTRAEINAVQPIYTWGAVNKAIRAAELGAESARKEFEAKRKGAELQLFELYYSYLLATEIERILEDAESTLRQVGRQIEEMREEGDPNLKEKDIFQYEIYRSEFEIERTRVKEGVRRIQHIWNYILADSEGRVYLPREDFLDPLPFEIEPFETYQARALESRSEIRAVETGIEALRHSVDAIRAQNYPSFYIGMTASFANTPNRPRQSNPFIINNTNYLNAAVGFGIRQNLNFSSIRKQVQRQEIEYNRTQDLKHALSDAIILEISENYQDAVVAETRVRQLEEALKTTREWVRHEQLNYDFGIGEVEDLIDAVRKELELRVELKESIYDLNNKLAKLANAAGHSIRQLGLY